MIPSQHPLVLVDTELGARRAGLRLQLGSHLPWEPLLTPSTQIGVQKVMEWSSLLFLLFLGVSLASSQP